MKRTKRVWLKYREMVKMMAARRDRILLALALRSSRLSYLIQKKLPEKILGVGESMSYRFKLTDNETVVRQILDQRKSLPPLLTHLGRVSFDYRLYPISAVSSEIEWSFTTQPEKLKNLIIKKESGHLIKIVRSESLKIQREIHRRAGISPSAKDETDHHNVPYRPEECKVTLRNWMIFKLTVPARTMSELLPPPFQLPKSLRQKFTLHPETFLSERVTLYLSIYTQHKPMHFSKTKPKLFIKKIKSALDDFCEQSFYLTSQSVLMSLYAPASVTTSNETIEGFHPLYIMQRPISKNNSEHYRAKFQTNPPRIRYLFPDHKLKLKLMMKASSPFKREDLLPEIVKEHSVLYYHHNNSTIESQKRSLRFAVNHIYKMKSMIEEEPIIHRVEYKEDPYTAQRRMETENAKPDIVDEKNFPSHFFDINSDFHKNIKPSNKKEPPADVEKKMILEWVRSHLGDDVVQEDEGFFIKKAVIFQHHPKNIEPTQIHYAPHPRRLTSM